MYTLINHKSIFYLITILSFQFINTSLNGGLNPLEWLQSNNNREILNLENKDESISKSLVRKAEAKKAKGNISATQRIYKSILLKYPKVKAAGSIAYERGIYLYEKNKWIDAFNTFTIIKQYHPSHPKLKEVIKLQYKCAEKTMHKQRKKSLGIFAPDPLNMDATPLFISFAALYPYDKNSPKALLNAARISETCGELELAIGTLKQLIDNYPKSAVSPDAHIQIAFAYTEFIKGPAYDLETTREAIRYCEDFLALFPDHADIGKIEALYGRLLNTLANNRVILADYYYFSRRDNIAALIFYNEAITLAPDSQAAIEAKVRIDSIKQGVQPTTGTNFIKKLFFIR